MTEPVPLTVETETESEIEPSTLTLGGLVARQHPRHDLGLVLGSRRSPEPAPSSPAVSRPSIFGSIQRSFATGAVTGGDGSFLGGLVAYNVGIPELAQGSISQSYATGAVTGGAASTVGGLVALNFGTLDQTYAAGRVSGGPGSTTGGLVAANNFNIPQEVLNAINIPEFSVAPGTATNSYWDTQTTGQDTSAGGSPMTSAQLSSGLPPGLIRPSGAALPETIRFSPVNPIRCRCRASRYRAIRLRHARPVRGPDVPNRSRGRKWTTSRELSQANVVASLVNLTPQDPPKEPEVINTQSSEGTGTRLRRLGRLRQGQCRWKRRAPADQFRAAGRPRPAAERHAAAQRDALPQ